MKISIPGILGVSLLAISVAGCQSARLSPLRPAPAPAPQPLEPAPVSPIEKSELPPPSDPVTNDPTQFPEAPGADTAEDVDGSEGTDVAAAGTGGAVTREQMIGSWSVSTGGQSCQMFITLTKGSTGYRAGTRGCPGQAADIKAWDVSGQQVVFTGSDGSVVARVYNTGSESYDGQTTEGQRVSLRR